ncbi:MAG: hypothetical protein LBU10_01175 [Endomicrobium sp.]|jgi:hypothetical protein|nr:hypothetical protein [Endomicrobium sp.]
MGKIYMKVHFGIELNHPLEFDFFKANLFLKGDFSDVEEVLLGNLEYYKMSIRFGDWQYMKCAHLSQSNRLSEKIINIDENYLKKVFEMIEDDIKLLNAEFENIDEYNKSKTKMMFIVKTFNNKEKEDKDIPRGENELKRTIWQEA